MSPYRCGTAHQNAKLSDEDVAFILGCRLTITELAVRFNVSKATISLIRGGKRRAAAGRGTMEAQPQGEGSGRPEPADSAVLSSGAASSASEAPASPANEAGASARLKIDGENPIKPLRELDGSESDIGCDIGCPQESPCPAEKTPLLEEGENIGHQCMDIGVSRGCPMSATLKTTLTTDRADAAEVIRKRALFTSADNESEDDE